MLYLPGFNVLELKDAEPRVANTLKYAWWSMTPWRWSLEDQGMFNLTEPFLIYHLHISSGFIYLLL